MIIITSGDYITPELQAELGRLPPSMLPIGNRRLFEHQVRVLRRQFGDEAIYLSLPETFKRSRQDVSTLSRAGIEVVEVAEGLSLSASLGSVLKTIGVDSSPLRVLHGDTLVEQLPEAPDVIGTVTTRDDYAWHVERKGIRSEVVWCGFFSLSDARLLARCLNTHSLSFVDAINMYDHARPLAREPVMGWHDLGHAHTYFRSRTAITTQRTFNTLRIADGCVRKAGAPREKIRAEANWFCSMPPVLKRYAPQLIDKAVDGDEEAFYVLEYLHLLPLNELFVHGRNPSFFWDKIFNHCDAFLSACARAGSADPNPSRTAEQSRRLIFDKTCSRLSSFAGARDIDLDVPTRFNGRDLPSLREIMTICAERAFSYPWIDAFSHGDLCFSNILFDPRGDLIKVVDPRGMDMDGQPAVFGDARYDLAKLAHSVIGLYDYIIAGAFELDTTGALDFHLRFDESRRLSQIQAAFLQRRYLGGIAVHEVLPLTVLLFLSMLSLHGDDRRRQDALLANALRMFTLVEAP